MPASTKNGRSSQKRTMVNTVVPKSATQAILMKQDEIIDQLNAIRAALETAADVSAVNAAAAALSDLEKVKLIR